MFIYILLTKNVDIKFIHAKNNFYINLDLNTLYCCKIISCTKPSPRLPTSTAQDAAFCRHCAFQAGPASRWPLSGRRSSPRANYFLHSLFNARQSAFTVSSPRSRSGTKALGTAYAACQQKRVCMCIPRFISDRAEVADLRRSAATDSCWQGNQSVFYWLKQLTGVISCRKRLL